MPDDTFTFFFTDEGDSKSEEHLQCQECEEGVVLNTISTDDGVLELEIMLITRPLQGCLMLDNMHIYMGILFNIIQRFLRSGNRLLLGNARMMVPGEHIEPIKSLPLIDVAYFCK